MTAVSAQLNPPKQTPLETAFMLYWNNREDFTPEEQAELEQGTWVMLDTPHLYTENGYLCFSDLETAQPSMKFVWI